LGWEKPAAEKNVLVVSGFGGRDPRRTGRTGVSEKDICGLNTKSGKMWGAPFSSWGKRGNNEGENCGRERGNIMFF